jgi:hypothetical protein
MGSRLEVLVSTEHKSWNHAAEGRVVFWITSSLHDALKQPQTYDDLLGRLREYSGPEGSLPVQIDTPSLQLIRSQDPLRCVSDAL